MSKTIVFFGNERLATGVYTTCPTLQALIAAGYEIAAVVSSFEQAQSRNARELEIQIEAEKHSIPVLLPNKPIEIVDQLKSLGAEVGVLVAYGKIVPQTVIDIFPRGIVNIHPSMLPKHRGPTPLESVILDGSESTGVSIMQLAREMDAGPVFAQSEVKLSGSETKQELADKLLTTGSAMLIENLPGILDGSLTPKPQDESAATYDKLISKEDGQIDWNKTAVQIEREIRAYAEWPKSRTSLHDREVIVTSAHVESSPTDEKQLEVPTGNGKLIIDKLKPVGKNEMTGREFLAGYCR